MLQFRPARWILAFYTLPVGLYLAFTWYNSRPEYHGMNWILVCLLTLPGCEWQLLFSDREFVSMGIAARVGLALNTSAMFLIAWLFSRLPGPRQTVNQAPPA